MDDAKRARRRALRAARVATLGLALAGGCYAQHGTEEPEPIADAAALDMATAPDLGTDLGTDLGVDLGTDMFAADAGAPCALDESWSECCDRVDWACDGANTWGCCAWGPYVPPGDGALPSSRERIG